MAGRVCPTCHRTYGRVNKIHVWRFAPNSKKLVLVEEKNCLSCTGENTATRIIHAASLALGSGRGFIGAKRFMKKLNN